MGFLLPKQQQNPNIAPPNAGDLPTPQGNAPAMAPQGTKPKKRSMQPTFLGSGGEGTQMQSNVGGKILLGA